MSRSDPTLIGRLPRGPFPPCLMEAPASPGGGLSDRGSSQALASMPDVEQEIEHESHAGQKVPPIKGARKW